MLAPLRRVRQAAELKKENPRTARVFHFQFFLAAETHYLVSVDRAVTNEIGGPDYKNGLNHDGAINENALTCTI